MNWIDTTGWKKPSQNRNRLSIPARKYFSQLEKGNQRQLRSYLVQNTFLASFYFLIHMVHTTPTPPHLPEHKVKVADPTLSEDYHDSLKLSPVVRISQTL